jgi:hypothetical protein
MFYDAVQLGALPQSTSGPLSRPRYRLTPVLSQLIVRRLDHQRLEGRIPIEGQLSQRLQSFWVIPRQDAPRSHRQ